MSAGNMNPQVVDVCMLGVTNSALKLLFVKKWFQLFFEMAKSEVRGEILLRFKLFVADIAFLGSFLVRGDQLLSPFDLVTFTTTFLPVENRNSGQTEIS